MQIPKWPTLPSLPANLRTSALISFLVVLPFTALEVKNRLMYNEEFPIALFGVLWLLPLSFILISLPMVRKLRAASFSTLNARDFAPGMLLVLIAWLWIVLVIDQAPCFLGVPNCD